jgi:hypothetical protein
MFSEFQLQPILFTAEGDDHLLDDCCVLDRQGRDLRCWDEVIPARASELEASLKDGSVHGLSMDSPRQHAVKRDDWRACASLAQEGVFYLGFETGLVSNLNEASTRAVDMINRLCDVCYGTAYESTSADYPDGYAHGFAKTTLDDVRTMIRNRGNWDLRPKCPDELWREEINGRKRYLDGLFRGAYPANVLSAAHVSAADLLVNPIGRLSEFTESLWLWELSAEEIPVAEAMLEARRLLVRQASGVAE